ncbi:VPS10 domain-containing protein [Psychroserpens sp.]|uniref:VPS10 domain-containing protein n=1 Tax=Psychroserpens sp. TaxID=2020870 RepID=UPI001B05547D|nr:glycosyl hydrolase [Psychroserpens sp.]MBO6607744.1 glycosyl hydrolase [Psychroserpens sp.]MBO6630211.1 glycosyl hydrolase [Psychroserpens sp.]MBO6654735.1 glycosyl hydrolase [Psychroserpens sp.]MBO6682841.1 glycosyl hydrolase [Psychroserpens sp.]MBO6751102.1 glycosyl hydrolase [Psychroserpens sp.]
MKKVLYVCLALLLSLSQESIAQKKSKKSSEEKTPLEKVSLSGLKWRNVGPALTSGRISDFAVNPNNPFEYYVATSSGGVWKTVNAGVTYEPIFDSQGSYSIGCVTMDPNNSNVIWVGTGENNNQRSVAYGDGLYKSIDGGKSWKHVGLKNSEHIGKIIVHPDNSDVVYVAAIGPLWSKGGDRGLYKTEDGGKTWTSIIEVDEHTGVNDVVMDPRNPDVLYASTLQRRRHVYTYVGGGPGSGMHKSVDGGKTWSKIQTGLPSVELGRIGLAISPANPEIIYAIVEAADRKGGFYASTNRGASWEKRSSHVTSGNYYQEIIADPVDEHTVYSMDTWMSVTRNGGKSFDLVGEDTKHVDNHCMWINPHNNKHFLVGCDGGIYETFDGAKTWDFKKNLPVTQFYKVAVDNDSPFYNIYGGTQDNFSIGGPSRVLTEHGIRNSEWFITNGGDGFESQIDPNNPNIVYAQSQYGGLVRFDKKSGEAVGIKPKARKGENAYRFNWDAPLVVSRHMPGRLYFSANKVFRSDDYGNSWDVISEDLSQQIDRNTLKVYGRVLSIDAVMKNGSTSLYGSIVAFSESPLNKDLLAAGTDDGLIHISEDGGSSWRKISSIPGAPNQSYVNSVYLSKHDENVIYAAFNHHKFGDFKPYVFMSSDKGNSWKAIQSNLPDRGSVYAIEEDHIDNDLIFAGTEFGAFFSPDKGENWKQLKAGLPTIAVRDIAIQERENDLVLGTFGRGFYVMDDYSVLRNIENSDISEDAIIYPIRTALMWEKSSPLGLPGKSFQGDNFYTAPNLGPEAMITYYYGSDFKSLKDQRQKEEKELIKSGADTPYPSYTDLKAEVEEDKQELVFTIKDANGRVVKKEFRSAKKGVQRLHWDLRYTLPDPIDLSSPSFYNPFGGRDEGTLVAPGTYTVEMALMKDGVLQSLSSSRSFEVKALNNTELPAADREEKVAFQKALSQLSADFGIVQNLLSESRNKVRYMKAAIKRAEQPLGPLTNELRAIEKQLDEVQLAMYGDPVKRRLDIDQPPSPASRLGSIGYEQKYSTSTPTQTHVDSYNIAKDEVRTIKSKMEQIYNNDIKNFEEKLINLGAPYTPGRGYENDN